MKKKDDKKKEDFLNFKEVIQQYEIRECIFQPNISNEDENKTNKKINSTEMVHRLYDDALKNKIKNKENLEQKYKPSFKPKLNDASIRLAHKRKHKLLNNESNLNLTKNKNNMSMISSQKRLNNSEIKRKNKKADLGIKERKSSVYNSKRKIDNEKIFEKSCIAEIKTTKKDENEDEIHKKIEETKDSNLKKNISDELLKENSENKSSEKNDLK